MEEINTLGKNEPDKDPCRDNRKVVVKTTRSIDEYMKERVKFKIDLYFCKAKRQRLRHHFFSLVIAISAALVPVLINLELGPTLLDLSLIATFFSILVSIGVACQEIFRFREHWRNYDLIESRLRSEEMLFSMSAGPYEKGKATENKEILFVERVEDLIRAERWDTITMRTATKPKGENEESLSTGLTSFNPTQE